VQTQNNSCPTTTGAVQITGGQYNGETIQRIVTQHEDDSRENEDKETSSDGQVGL